MFGMWGDSTPGEPRKSTLDQGINLILRVKQLGAGLLSDEEVDKNPRLKSLRYAGLISLVNAKTATVALLGVSNKKGPLLGAINEFAEALHAQNELYELVHAGFDNPDAYEEHYLKVLQDSLASERLSHSIEHLSEIMEHASKPIESWFRFPVAVHGLKFPKRNQVALIEW